MNMTCRLMVAVGVVLLSAGTAAAQTTSKTTETGTAQFTVAQVSGEVVAVDDNYVLVKIRPSGVQRWFSVSPDRKFIIDGQPKTVSQLAPGTMLTATAVTKTLPVTVRTTTITNGTVLNVTGRTLSVRLENGERRSYTGNRCRSASCRRACTSPAPRLSANRTRRFRRWQWLRARRPSSPGAAAAVLDHALPPPRQADGAIDHADHRVGLREVAPQLAGARVDVLAQQAETIAV